MLRSNWIISLIAILSLCLTLSASYWQFQRADYKRQLETRFENMQMAEILELNTNEAFEGNVVYRKVASKGKFYEPGLIALDNQIRRGQAGYEIFAPLLFEELEGGVLVSLGWIPREREFGELPEFDIPDGPVVIGGTIVEIGVGGIELSDVTINGNIWQNIDLDRYRSLFSIDVVDFVIQADESSFGGEFFERSRPEFSFGREKHLSYAGQWLLFSLLIGFFYIYYGFIRGSTKK